MKLKKNEFDLKFRKKRDYKLTTPCCGRSNKDGKYVNYIGLEDNYGYCHSCGKTTLPLTIYEDDTGKTFVWDEIQSRYIPTNELNIKPLVALNQDKFIEPEIRFIEDKLVFDSLDFEPENNLLQYIRNTYGDEKTDDMIDNYFIGTTPNGKTQFWHIDINKKVRKDKVVLFNTKGKRTSDISATFLNSNGYKTCLFGEHLLSYSNKEKGIIILVESEKTAIISSILFPKYTWLSYGSINGLSKPKMDALIGYRVLIIPDISENAVAIVNKNILEMKKLNIDVTVWDMTGGRTDAQLKNDGEYGQDLEDLFRQINTEDIKTIN